MATANTSLRVLNATGMYPHEAKQLRLAEAALAEAQRLAEQLVEHLQSFSNHALNTNEGMNYIDIPDSLEMAVALSRLVRDYVTEPYTDLCSCRAPLMQQTCPICGEQMCTGNGLYGIAPVSLGRDCERTPATWQVTGTTDQFVEVCNRHTYEEVSAQGLDYCDVDDSL